MGILPEGFNVIDEVEIGSLDDIKESKPLIPATKNVLFSISKVRPFQSEDGKYKAFELGLQLVDGIDGKWKNSWVNSDGICYYADTEKYTKDFFKERQHLRNLKTLLKATGIQTTKVNDELFKELEGKKILADIYQVPNNYTAKDGAEISETVNQAKFFKPVPTEQLV